MAFLPPTDDGQPYAVEEHQQGQFDKNKLSWAEHVAGSSGIKSGMTIRFFQPSQEDSKTIVSPPPEVEDEGAKKWEKCLIGYFLDSQIPQAYCPLHHFEDMGKTYSN